MHAEGRGITCITHHGITTVVGIDWSEGRGTFSFSCAWDMLDHFGSFWDIMSHLTCSQFNFFWIRLPGKPRPKDLVHTRNYQNCCCCEGVFVCWDFFHPLLSFSKRTFAPSKPCDSGLTFSTFVVGTHGKTRQMRTKTQGSQGSEPS